MELRGLPSDLIQRVAPGISSRNDHDCVLTISQHVNRNGRKVRSWFLSDEGRRACGFGGPKKTAGYGREAPSVPRRLGVVQTLVERSEDKVRAQLNVTRAAGDAGDLAK